MLSLNPPQVERIPSWEAVEGADGRLPKSLDPGRAEDPAAAQAALRQLVELGYISSPSETVRRSAIAHAEAEAEFNLAASLFLKVEDSLNPKKLLRGLTERYPDEARYWRILGQVCLSRREHWTRRCPARRRSRASRVRNFNRPHLSPQRSGRVVARMTWRLAAAAFGEAEQIAPNDPTTQTYLGRLYLRQRRWADAERAFRRTLDIDPDSRRSALWLKRRTAATGSDSPRY